MGTLLTMVAKFVADVAQFKKDLDAAESKTDKLKTSLTKTAQVTSGVVTAGVAAAAGGLAYAANKSAAWGETLDGLADHLGTSTEESAGLALMVDRVGGNVDQLTGAMDIMTRGMLDAEGGLGPAGEAMQRLGVSVYDAEGNVRSATAVFGDVANVLGNMPDGLEKTSLMMDIFGKSGGDMGDVLAAAANGGLAQFQEQAKSLGLAFSQEQVDGIIEGKKKWEELKQTFDGLVISVGAGVIPVLADALTAVTDWAKSEAGRAAIEGVAKAITGLVTGFINLPAPAQGAIVAVTGLLMAAGPLATLITTLSGAWATLGPIVTGAGTILAGVSLPVLALIAAIGGLIAVIVIFGQDAWNTVTMIGKIFEATFGGVIKKNIEVFIAAIEGIGRAIADVITWVSNLGSSFGRLRIPDWLTPGSPTPFELGIRGISSAMRDSVGGVMPQYQSALSMQGAGAGAAQMQAAPVIDYDRLAEAVARAVKDAVVQVTG